jgi:hypothetical protein
MQIRCREQQTNARSMPMYEVSPALPDQQHRPGGLSDGWLWPLVSLLILYVLFVLIPVLTSGMYRWSDEDIILHGTFDPIFYADLTIDDLRLSFGILLTISAMFLLPGMLLVAIVILGITLIRQRPTMGMRDRRVRHLALLVGTLSTLLFTWPLADTFLTWLAD